MPLGGSGMKIVIVIASLISTIYHPFNRDKGFLLMDKITKVLGGAE